MKAVLLSLIFFNVMTKSSVAQDKTGWIKLSGEAGLSGWHLFKQPAIQPAWNSVEGVISMDASKREGRGDIVTDAIFEDFELRFEWKVSKGSNSGIIFLVQESEAHDATWHTGPEFQVIDNTGYPDKLEAKQMAGSLYDLIPCAVEYIKPTGEWNTTVIKLERGKLEFIVNGKNTVSTTLWNADWDSLVADSKFGTLKNFAKKTTGKIAIQDHGGGASYRNIIIKKL
ncbi:MAG: 3-keto-disaccharide hydrolase [Chitinophagaceae bacterium]